MFTGIVEATCPVDAVEDLPGRRRLRIDLSPLRTASSPGSGSALCALGDSLAVAGVCLTVAALEGDVAAFDVITETLGRTTLGALRPGRTVNIERALLFGGRIDGHLVQGHVETTARVRARQVAAGQTTLAVQCGADFARRCLPKGSVTVDGVSLTVAALSGDAFTVALVPHTLARTTLGSLGEGDVVNLEADLIGSWVLRALETRGVIPPH